MRFFAILFLVATALCLPSVAGGRVPPIFTPPADVHFEVTSAGMVARWWQTGSATHVVMTIECGGKDAAFYEVGHTGDHLRVMNLTDGIPYPLRVCLRIAEYDDGTFLGQTAKLPLTLALVFLPVVSR